MTKLEKVPDFLPLLSFHMTSKAIKRTTADAGTVDASIGTIFFFFFLHEPELQTFWSSSSTLEPGKQTIRPYFTCHISNFSAYLSFMKSQNMNHFYYLLNNMSLQNRKRQIKTQVFSATLAFENLTGRHIYLNVSNPASDLSKRDAGIEPDNWLFFKFLNQQYDFCQRQVILIVLKLQFQCFRTYRNFKYFSSSKNSGTGPAKLLLDKSLRQSIILIRCCKLLNKMLTL